MKIKNGVPFEIRTEHATAKVVVENFSPAVIERFNELMADAILKQFESQELRRA